MKITEKIHLENTPIIPPEFIRLPKAGKSCPYSGLSRSTLNNLILPCPANGFRPTVKSVSLRRRGTIRGTRLIVYDSFMDYLRSHIVEGEEQ